MPYELIIVLACGVLAVAYGVWAAFSVLGEDAGTLEDVHEPYLIMQGYIKRTPQGRVALTRAYRKLGLDAPKKSQSDLFEAEN